MVKVTNRINIGACNAALCINLDFGPSADSYHIVLADINELSF